jgi:hypothetical protein
MTAKTAKRQASFSIFDMTTTFLSENNTHHNTKNTQKTQQQCKKLEVPQFFCGWRDDPAPSTVHALAARKKSPLLNDLRYNAKC